jgi:hypothetical protein
MDARRRRSRGLTQINRLTAWVAGGALVASGGFVALLARPSTHPAPTAPANGSTGAGPSVTAPPTGATTVDPNATDPVGGSSDGGYQDGSGATVAPTPINPPVQVPRPSSRQAQVTTGAS